MNTLKPLQAVAICVVAGMILIPGATYFSTDRGSVFIAGVGALGQVIVAVLLYYITREQLEHAKSEAAYRKREQQLIKLERVFDDMVRTEVSYNNAKTGMGKTSFDGDQMDRLLALKDDVRRCFAQPASTEFNSLCRLAGVAQKLVKMAGYAEQIEKFSAQQKVVYAEIKKQVDAKRLHIAAYQADLNA